MEPIAPVPLKAMPEVTTCVGFQDRLERTAGELVHVDVPRCNLSTRRGIAGGSNGGAACFPPDELTH